MKNNKVNIAVISVFFAILSIILYGKSGNVLIDFSRESYIPYQMLNGDVLNKDIFLIYGPFGYLLNTFLYKISLNINLLLIEAVFMSYLAVILFYFTVKKYTKKEIALGFTLFFILISIVSPSAFSFFMPYSYSTLWAVLGVYIFLFCELYKRNKFKYFILGFIAINKIELFVLTFIFALVFDICNKKFKIKNALLCSICPLVSLIGFSLSDFIYNSNYISRMLAAKSLTGLYKVMGSFFDFEYFKFNLVYLAIYLIFALISYFLFKKQKILSILLLAFLFVKVYPNLFFHLGFFIAVILSAINRKKIKQKDIILLFFCFVLCSKSIFAIDSLLYSNFGYCLMIFYIIRQMYLLLNKKWVIWQFVVLFASLSVGQFFVYFNNPKVPFKTDIGTIWLFNYDYNLFKQIEGYLKDNLKKGETFIVLPEGQILNLIYKTPWGFYNSTFTPLDFEVFGDKNLAERLKENKTDYIIFYPRNTEEYGSRAICFDYAVDFCKFIDDNYKRDAIFGDSAEVLIYKINEKNK